MLLAENAFEIRPSRKIGTDLKRFRARGLPGEQLPIRVQQADAAVVADVQAPEQVVEVRQAQRPGGDPGKLALRPGNTPAEADAPVQVTQFGLEWRAHQQPQVSIVLVRPEDPGIAKVGLSRHAVGGVTDHVALLVQPKHVTALAVDERLVEQQTLAQRAGNFRKLLAPNGPDQPFERLVVQLGIAQDVAFDQLHDVVG